MYGRREKYLKDGKSSADSLYKKCDKTRGGRGIAILVSEYKTLATILKKGLENITDVLAKY